MSEHVDIEPQGAMTDTWGTPPEWKSFVQQMQYNINLSPYYTVWFRCAGHFSWLVVKCRPCLWMLFLYVIVFVIETCGWLSCFYFVMLFLTWLLIMESWLWLGFLLPVSFLWWHMLMSILRHFFHCPFTSLLKRILATDKSNPARWYVLRPSNRTGSSGHAHLSLDGMNA